MFIRIKKKDEKRWSVQIVEAVRDGKHVRQKILRHVGVAHHDKEIAELKKVAEFIRAQIEEDRQPRLISPEEVARIRLQGSTKQKKEEANDASLMVDLKELREESRYVVGIHDVYGQMFEELKFASVIEHPSHHQAVVHILKNLVMARIANPSSKRDAVVRLEEDFGISLSLDAVYRAMDKINDKVIERIKTCSLKAALQLFKEKVDVLFYDCTTLYFEAFEEDDLRKKGYSKDFKFNQPQVLLALCVTKEGIPVGYEVFPGNMYEGHTLSQAMDQLKKHFSLDKVVLVADSGLLNAQNLDFIKSNGFYYIVGARLKNMNKSIQEKILNPDLYTQKEEDRLLSVSWISPKEDQDSKTVSEKLIVHYSPKRAFKDQADRLQAVIKLQKKLKKSQTSKDYLSNYGYKKYLKIEGEQNITLDQEKIDLDAQWDGLHGVVTNVDWMADEDIIDQYKGLWQVEESFRIQKHDLKVRPIFHWKEERIKAHIALCYMAFTCIRHLEYRTKTQYQKLSPEVIRRELIHVQETLLTHQKTKEQYAIPSKMGLHAERIYRLMGLQRSQTPYKIHTTPQK